MHGQYMAAHQHGKCVPGNQQPLKAAQHQLQPRHAMWTYACEDSGHCVQVGSNPTAQQGTVIVCKVTYMSGPVIVVAAVAVQGPKQFAD